MGRNVNRRQVLRALFGAGAGAFVWAQATRTISYAFIDSAEDTAEKYDVTLDQAQDIRKSKADCATYGAIGAYVVVGSVCALAKD